MAPVRRGDGACGRQVAPILVVISDTVGKYQLCVVYGQVDNGECVRNSVGSEEVREHGLVSAYYIWAVGVMCWCTLGGSVTALSAFDLRSESSGPV